MLNSKKKKKNQSQSNTLNSNQKKQVDITDIIGKLLTK